MQTGARAFVRFKPSDPIQELKPHGSIPPRAASNASMKILTGLACFTLLASLPLHAAGLLLVHDEHFWRGPNHPAPQPRPRPHPVPSPTIPLESRRTDIDTRIRGPEAVTRIEQAFYNPNGRTLEGTFLFPVPRGAHLDHFTLEIDGEPVEAELLAADKARGIYEHIVRQMKDPGLLEYAGQDLFKVRIYPIEPRATRVISLSYTELLRADNGLTCYRLPMRVPGQEPAPIQKFSLHVRVETDSPLTTVYSPTHTIDTERQGKDRADLTLQASPFHPDRDFELYFGSEDSRIGLHLLTHRTAEGEGYFALLATPGPARERAMPKDVVFVLDTSGSMSGKKLDQARNALAFCVDNLRDSDRFEVIQFSSGVEPLFTSLVPANDSNRRKAREFVEDLRAVGGTAIAPALDQALARRPPESDRPFVVIFLTDGRPTVGETKEESIVASITDRRERFTRVFCFGIGNDVNTHLLDRITEATRAASQYVRPEEDLELKVSSFFTKINEPVLTDVELEFPEGVRARELHPHVLPDLFQGDQLVVVGRYQGSGSGVIRLRGKVQAKDKEHTYDADFPDRADRHDFIPRLWATRRVGYLLDEIRLRGESDELKEEVTQLARRHGIVTPYTAYLITEDEKRRGITEHRRLLAPDFYQDRTRESLGRTYSRLEQARTGAEAVDSARALQLLKSANASTDALLAGNREVSPNAPAATTTPSPAISSTPTPKPSSQSGLTAAGQPVARAASQTTREVAGRAFYLQDDRWTDSESLTEAHKDAKPTRIEFGSDAYFKLLNQYPEAAPILALGQQVVFVLKGTLFEVHPSDAGQ